MASEHNSKLARMMRECAALIDRNEFHPSMYQVIGDLHSYAGKHGDAKGQLSTNQSNSKASWSALGKKFSSFGIASSSEKTKQATSSRNAERLKQELNDTPEDDSWTSWWTGSIGGADTDTPAAPSKPGKPAFQRPTNPKSTLIANGWIEQLRRSKMRVVWKDVLASLVEGRKPNEESTLWIQREVQNATTGKADLEALHQIPIKWLQQVKYLDFYGDYRFAIKVYNISDEFVFRCADEESAQNWILTLRSVKAESQQPGKTIEPQQQVEATVPFDEGKAASSASSINIATPPVSGGAPASIRSVNSSDSPATAPVDAPPSEQAKPRTTVKEMRAIAHGAGINTQGMERSDLERTVARITRPAVAVTSSVKDNEERHRQDVEAARRRQELEHQESLQRRADAEAMEREHDDDKRRQLEESQRLRVTTARRKAEEEELRRAAEEQRRADEQRRAAVVAEQRRAVDEQRRRAAEHQAAEQRRRQEEERARAQQHYQHQQQVWQQQQQASQQAWAAQQAAQQAVRQQQAQRAQQEQWQQWQKQQHQQQQPKYPQQQQQNPFGGSQQQQQRPAAPAGDTSTADLKYTKMAADDAKDDEVAAVKRNILVHWALQPPQLQHLRPIADLLCTIHTVFPPAFGVVGHDYFAKWNSINRTDLIPVGSGPDEEKLKKGVRKLRFFLHPDKLPRDLSEEQTFMCKMLWDISSDAWEEFKKRHEELDWMQK